MQVGELDESGESQCVEFTELLNGDFQKYGKHQGRQKRRRASRRDIRQKVRANVRKTLQNTRAHLFDEQLSTKI